MVTFGRKWFFFCLLHVEVAFGCIARFPKVQASIIGDSAFIHYFLVACSHHFPFAQSHPFHVNIQSSRKSPLSIVWPIKDYFLYRSCEQRWCLCMRFHPNTDCPKHSGLTWDSQVIRFYILHDELFQTVLPILQMTIHFQECANEFPVHHCQNQNKCKSITYYQAGHILFSSDLFVFFSHSAHFLFCFSFSLRLLTFTVKQLAATDTLKLMIWRCTIAVLVYWSSAFLSILLEKHPFSTEC